MAYQLPTKLKTKIDLILDDHNPPSTKLLATLRAIQHHFHYLPSDPLQWLARTLNISITRIYSTASFYSELTFIPRGTHHLSLCKGVSCLSERSEQLLQWLQEQYQLQPGGVTDDGFLSLELVSCQGACDRGPVLYIDEVALFSATPGRLKTHLDHLQKGEKDG